MATDTFIPALYNLDDLPDMATATDVIDLLTEHVAHLVVMTNIDTVGVTMTQAQFQAAFDRTFAVALPEFLARLDRARPGLGERVRAQFLAEYELANA